MLMPFFFTEDSNSYYSFNLLVYCDVMMWPRVDPYLLKTCITLLLYTFKAKVISKVYLSKIFYIIKRFGFFIILLRTYDH